MFKLDVTKHPGCFIGAPALGVPNVVPVPPPTFGNPRGGSDEASKVFSGSGTLFWWVEKESVLPNFFYVGFSEGLEFFSKNLV